VKAVAEQIGEHHDPKTIYERLRSMCGVEHVSVRQPHQSAEYLESKHTITEWHRDGDGKPYAIVVWSNRESTEVKADATGEILRFPPGAIVLIRNRKAMHRLPPVVSPDRWFARALKIKKLDREERK
jgi:hypothetical protein